MINKRKGFIMGLNKKAIIIAALDVLSISIAFFAALWLRFDFQFNSIDPEYLHTYCRIILPWCAVSIVMFSLFRLYSSIWSFVSTDELMQVLEAYGVLTVAAFVLVKLLHVQCPYPSLLQHKYPLLLHALMQKEPWQIHQEGLLFLCRYVAGICTTRFYGLRS